MMKWPVKLLLAALCGCGIVLLQKLISVGGDAFTITASGQKQFVWGLPLAVSHSLDPSLDDSTAAIVTKSVANALFWSALIVAFPVLWNRTTNIGDSKTDSP